MKNEKKIIIVLLVLICVLIGYLIIKYIKANQEVNNNNNNTLYTEPEEKINITLNVEKINQNEDVIVDTKDSNEMQKKPYININTEDAKIVNTYIEKLNETIQYTQTSYEYYANDEILSIVMSIKNNQQDDNINYMIWNFNLNTGFLVGKEDIINKKNIEHLEEKMDLEVEKLELAELEKLQIEDEELKNQQLQLTIENFKKMKNENSIGMFLNQDGDLNIIANLYLPTGVGIYPKIITIR